MKEGRTKLVIICVDGAVPEIARSNNFFSYGESSSIRNLKSVYPSSTATAHASFMTGESPSTHGIVGNRFWDNSIEDIAAKKVVLPHEALHPYEYSSLMSSSLLDDICEENLTYGGVVFPHTFSKSHSYSGCEAMHYLYSPSETIRLEAVGEGDVKVWNWQFHYHTFRVEVAIKAEKGRLRFFLKAGEGTIVEGDNCCSIRALSAAKEGISFSLQIKAVEEEVITLYRTTAVHILGFGLSSLDSFMPLDALPHSEEIDYQANGENDFHESPSIPWVTMAGKKMLERGHDIVFIRYPQVDHAQEILYWYCIHGEKEQRERAWSELIKAYQLVSDDIKSIVDLVDDTVPVLLFSDHGIDYVDHHVHINSLLPYLGLEGTHLFQGDSNCAYLYGPPVDSETVAAFEAILQEKGVPASVASVEELREKRVYNEQRCGRLVLFSEPHVEFYYSEGPLVKRVKSASHGFCPENKSMDGIVSFLTGSDGELKGVEQITELRKLIQKIIRKK